MWRLLLGVVIVTACNGKEGGNGQSEPVAESEKGTGGDDKFADNIRKTPFQSPEEERKSFRLPPGFEITLFASEPDISKPINMEFDAAGRLWVTNTVEYPMPARGRAGRDRITILEDTDGDGRADKFTPFIDTLNIPIGVTPVRNGAIAYSIPNVYLFTDANGDGRADKAKKLIGPFEFEDTHGMVNNLVRGFDGWVYACHGYANNSKVAGSDGDSIYMRSGNTFRFREDGSRVEQTTFGRINPFGYAFDEWGYLYSLDCHTKPIYQLIPGAQYPAQGATEPSIGWAPAMMSYEFGSTANSGMVNYIGTQFPEAYQNNFFSGNVVTSRINRNTVIPHGATLESKREEDFLISDDPWFRPVDIKLGPDGSMYVADFYNRIIGHYEVPKDHPGRDRTSGRIWKITYTGSKKSDPAKPQNWSRASFEQLIAALNHPQLNIRMMLANLIVDHYGKQAIGPVTGMVETTNDPKALVQGLWILYRLNALSQPLLNKALTHENPVVQVHGLRILWERASLDATERSAAESALSSSNPQVRRLALQVVGRFPKFGYMQPLLNMVKQTDSLDTHLRYTAILSLRSHLRQPDILQQVTGVKWSEEDLQTIVPILPEISSRQAALFAFGFLKTHKLSQRDLEYQLNFISRYANAAQLDELVSLARQQVTADSLAEYKLYKAMSLGVAQRGDAEGGRLKQWGARMEKLGLAPVKAPHVVPLAEENAAERKKIIEERIASYKPAAVTVSEGKKVFTQNCTACHRIGDEPGGSIGPQLSGIGTWGKRALTEKILNPNGSISTAYRMYNLTLKDNTKISGLYRWEQDNIVVFANYSGQEFLVPKAQIKKQEAVRYTLMPDHFRSVISKQDFDALLKYLLSIKEKE